MELPQPKGSLSFYPRIQCVRGVHTAVRGRIKGDKRKSRIKFRMEQFPIVPAFSCTGHKMQGQTVGGKGSVRYYHLSLACASQRCVCSCCGRPANPCTRGLAVRTTFPRRRRQRTVSARTAPHARAGGIRTENVRHERERTLTRNKRTHESKAVVAHVRAGYIETPTGIESRRTIDCVYSCAPALVKARKLRKPNVLICVRYHILNLFTVCVCMCSPAALSSSSTSESTNY